VREQTGLVPLSSSAYLEGPLIVAVALAVIVLLCRWVFATDRPAPPTPARSSDFGLLEPVAVVRTVDDAQMLRELLRDAGIRGTLAPTSDGIALLVFRSDATRARDLVRS
jgi:hypothetical protein